MSREFIVEDILEAIDSETDLETAREEGWDLICIEMGDWEVAHKGRDRVCILQDVETEKCYRLYNHRSGSDFTYWHNSLGDWDWEDGDSRQKNIELIEVELHKREIVQVIREWLPVQGN